MADNKNKLSGLIQLIQAIAPVIQQVKLQKQLRDPRFARDYIQGQQARQEQDLALQQQQQKSRFTDIMQQQLEAKTQAAGKSEQSIQGILQAMQTQQATQQEGMTPELKQALAEYALQSGETNLLSSLLGVAKPTTGVAPETKQEKAELDVAGKKKKLSAVEKLEAKDSIETLATIGAIDEKEKNRRLAELEGVEIEDKPGVLKRILGSIFK